MDKNKNRTDLLAAGRKRLKQFREKKDNKASTSEVKSSKKSGKSKRRESDDSKLGSAVANPSEITQAPAATSSADPGPLIVNIEHESHPIEDSASLESNVTNPLPDMYEARDIDPTSETFESREDNVVSVVPNKEENLSTADVKVVEVSSLDDPNFTVSKGEVTPADVPASNDLSLPPGSTDDTERGLGTTEIESMNMKDELLHSSEDFSDVSTVKPQAVLVADVGTMQEADGLWSDQANRNNARDLDGDSSLISPEHGDSAQIIDSLMLKGHAMDERTSEAKQTMKQDDSSSGVDASLDGNLTSLSQSGTESKSAVISEATNEQRVDSAIGSYIEETSHLLSESANCIQGKDFVTSENATVAEVHNRQESLEPENKNGDKSQNSEMTTYIGCSEPGSSTSNLNSVSFSNLLELIKGLGNDEYRSLISLRESNYHTAVKDICTEYGLSDALERLKEELVFTNSVKGICDLQLAEQSDELEKVFDHQRHGLINEISRLKTSLDEVREENEYLSKELIQNKSELEAVANEKEDLQYQLNSAKAEIEELSGRAHDLQAVLEKSQENLSAMSIELADCKNLVAALQSENESVNRTLLSAIDERKNLAEEKEDWLQENKNLSTKLAESEKLGAFMQLDFSNLTDLLASEREGRKAVEEQKENLACEIERTLTELAEHKVIVTDLRMENDSLVGIISIVTEEKRKLEEEGEQIVHENERLSLELIILQEQLSKKTEERMQFQINLEKSLMWLEQLIEQNILLNISLDIHKSELREIDSWQTQVPPQDLEAVNQVEYADIQRGVHKVSIEDHISSKISSEQGLENFSSSVDEPLTDKHEKLPQPELHEQKFFNDSIGFVVLEGHLQEADEILQKLEKEVDSMHVQLASANRLGGKPASPGVSKLIQAFESNVTADEHEEKALTEDTFRKDPCTLTKEQTGRLRSVLKQLMMDAGNASIMFKGELESRKTVADAAQELSSQYEVLQEYSCSLEASNVELGVLYEAIKHHVSDVEHKNNELVGFCEYLKQQDISQKAENSELVFQVDASQLKISELEIQLHEMQHISEEKVSSISRQLEIVQKEAADNAFQLEKEWSSTISQLDGTVQKFEECIGRLFTPALSVTASDPNDIVGRVTASIDVASKVIEDMFGELQAAHVVEVVLHRSYDEMSERFNILHLKNAANVSVLHRLLCELKAFVVDSSELAEDGEMEMQNDELLDPADLGFFETLMGQLRSSLDEKLQLLSLNNHLSLEVKELTDKSSDLNALHDLVEDVVAVIKPEGSVFESDDPPAVRLKSLMFLLVRNSNEANEKLNFTLNECESKLTELTKMQEKIEDYRTMQIQQENEILVLKECLRQAEESLAASSGLREKSTELEQSEQRVSSLREKLSIAVAKGKGLVVQRDSLKQSLAEASCELEKCSEELKVKAARLCEVEDKLKAYSEAGERVEALESELSYIRNSATALRESFLLKDSVLQRIEEILEELDLPENFHSRGIIEKIDWLARSATGNSASLADWDQNGSVEGGSYPDGGFTASDAWREDGQPGSNSGDDLRRRFEDLQGKFYGLAEQNEMLEQSLMERNNSVQRWEELLDRIDMPPQLRSMDPVDRIEWLGAALSEAYHEMSTLQEKINKLECYCELMTSDLDKSKRQIADLEADIQEFAQGREQLLERLAILISDREKLSAMAVHHEIEKVTLEDEVNDLQDRLAETIDVEKNMLDVEHEIRRMQDMVFDALHDPDLKGMTYDSSTGCLEEWLRKLIESYMALLSAHPASSGEVDGQLSEKDVSSFHTRGTRDALDSQELDIVGLKKELEESLSELNDVKEERDSYLEKQQSLIGEVETMNSRIIELQTLLGQEEQKSVSVREKLNVAVRKGKSLIQLRDGLKQTIEELNNEVERLKYDLNGHVSALADYEQKVKILSSYRDRVEAAEAENSSLRNRLAEAEQYLHEKDNKLNTLLQNLGNIDTGKQVNISDPVKKLEQIGTLCRELHASVAYSEQEAMKSKRAAELLLAELNEVQERNDGLQEDLDKAANELEVLSRERNEAEAAKLEALSRLEKLSAAHIEERNNNFSQIMQFKSGIEQLKKGLYDIHDQLPYVLSKNLEFMRNVKVCLESFSEPSLITGVFNLPIIGSLEGFSQDKENFPSVDFWSGSHGQDLYDYNEMIEVCSYVARHIKETMSDVASLKENLQTFSNSLHEQANSLSEAMRVVQKEVNSQIESFEAMKRNITCLESNLEEKDSEINILQRNMSLLYESCASSISEIENRKAEILGNSLVSQDVGVTLNVDSSAGLNFSRHANLMAVVESMGDRLRKVVRDFASTNAKTLEGGQKELKTTIANLQKELQEKDIQRDRICVELVGQIKEAEAVANRHLVDLQSSKSRLSELEQQLRVMEDERYVLKQRVTELQDQHASSRELHEKVESLTEAVNAKDQEIEYLMQALDEEEAQMEDLKSKVLNMEKVVQQKDFDLENLESSRGKVMKKLSVTVAKFDELHCLSANLLTEVENLQSQLQEKDAEISFLRQEVTRCTNDALVASHMSRKSSTDEIHEFLTWLDTSISGVIKHDVHAHDVQTHELKERLQKKIMLVLSELANLQVEIQSKDALLQVERSRVEELTRKEEMLETSLRDNETQLGLLEDAGDSGPMISTTSEIVEVEPAINKWTVPATSSARQVRSLRKVNNDQVSIAIDTDVDGSNQLADEDDEKVHGFKSLTRSRIVPRFTRPVTDMIDGLWVSCDRALMRHPTLRLGIIIYWAILHALLATFVV